MKDSYNVYLNCIDESLIGLLSANIIFNINTCNHFYFQPQDKSQLSCTRYTICDNQQLLIAAYEDGSVAIDKSYRIIASNKHRDLAAKIIYARKSILAQIINTALSGNASRDVKSCFLFSRISQLKIYHIASFSLPYHA
jgi:hypothetical protein